MLDDIRLEHLICIDIETVPEHASFSDVPDALKPLYLSKVARLKSANESEEEQYSNHAGIFAEFGKIVCICLGLFRETDNVPTLRIKSIAGHDEKELLETFCQLLASFSSDRYQFCGHNIREFDLPFICRRLLIQHLHLPRMLDFMGKKPWEVNVVDTMQLWRFGDGKHFTSLKLLALLLGLDSPKDDIEGKDVGRVYWAERNLPRIVSYCQRDVATVGQLILRYKGLPPLQPEQIVFAT